MRKTLEQALQHAQAAWLSRMEDYKDSFGCVQMPLTPVLTERHLENCRLLPHREAILQRMKIGSVAAEVGVQTGNFSQSILNICQPSELHLLDLDLHSFNINERYRAEIERSIVHLHEGDSSEILNSFPEDYYDFVYIDGDHSYQGVKADIQAAKAKLKKHGFLIFNDYTYWSPLECMRYGVVQAVNELCIEEDWEAAYFALHPYMYCDVALKRR